MKTIACLVIFSTLALADAFGQTSGVIIKQRAREAAGRPPAPGPGQPGQPGGGGGATSSGPQVATAQQASLSKLQADIAIIKIRPEASTEMKDRLATNLLGAAPDSAKPAAAAIKELADSLAAAIAGKKISSSEQGQLARDLTTVMNSSTCTPAQVQAAIQSIHDALAGTTIASPDSQKILGQLKGLAAAAPKATAKSK